METFVFQSLDQRVDVFWVFGSDATVVNIENDHDFVSEQEAGVKSRLLEAKVLEGLAHVVEPQDGSDREAIQTFDESKTSVRTVRGAETTGQMDPHWFLELSLDKGRAEVDCHGLPVED